MLTRVKEMIDELHARPNASVGFTAKEVFEVGQTFGLTCREIYHTFLGKKNAIGYSRYLPQMPSAEVIQAAMANGPKKRGRKPGSKKVVAKAVIENDEPQIEAPKSNDDGEVFCWIASAQDLSEEAPLEKVSKSKGKKKQSKVS